MYAKIQDILMAESYRDPQKEMQRLGKRNESKNIRRKKKQLNQEVKSLVKKHTRNVQTFVLQSSHAGNKQKG